MGSLPWLAKTIPHHYEVNPHPSRPGDLSKLDGQSSLASKSIPHHYDETSGPTDQFIAPNLHDNGSNSTLPVPSLYAPQSPLSISTSPIYRHILKHIPPILLHNVDENLYFRGFYLTDINNMILVDGVGLMLDRANSGQQGVISWTAVFSKIYLQISYKKVPIPILLCNSVYRPCLLYIKYLIYIP